MILKEPNIGELADEIDEMGMRKWLIMKMTESFREARKGKIGTFNEHQYEVFWMENIVKLVDVILEKAYKPSGSVSFIIYDPMVREIFAAPFMDRVVHHFLYDMQGGWWDKRFIYDSYSCRDGKGTLFGIQRVQQMMRQASQNLSTGATVIKMDIKGYFMSLPREKLYKRVLWGLEEQFGMYLHRRSAYDLFKVCQFLWHQVLMDDPAQKSHRRGRLDAWSDLPPEKSLYTQDPGYGIVIGNLTSQLVSNIYLDMLDRHVKHDLLYKHYGRYVDDFILIISNLERRKALADIEEIRGFLKTEGELTLHPRKLYIQPVEKGVNFLGARIYPHCVYPSNRLQSKFRQELAKFLKYGYNAETVISYMGLMKHMDAEGFVEKVFRQYGLDFDLYLESKSDSRRSFEEIIWELRQSQWR